MSEEKISFKIHLSNGKIYDITEDSNQSLKSVTNKLFKKENFHFRITSIILNGKELIINKTITENNIKKGDNIKINIDSKMMNIFQQMTSLINNLEGLRNNINDKSLYYLISFAEKVLKIYLDKNKNKNFILVKRYLNYIKKFFLKYDIGMHKYKYSKNNNINNMIFAFSVIFSYIIFLEVIEYKNESKKSLNVYQKLIIINEILSYYIYNVANFYSIHLIDEKQLELFVKCLITLSISSNNEIGKNNDNIYNPMFLVISIKLLKIIFHKLFQKKII